MRFGEILGLTVDQIEILNPNDSRIKIEQAFSVVGGMKSPKGKKSRDTFIPTSLAKEMQKLAAENQNGNNLIFWSLTSRKSMRPVTEGYIRERFYDALLDVLDSENGFTPGKKVEDPEKSKPDKKVYKWEYDTVEIDGVQVRRAELVRRERNIVFHSFRHYYVTRATSVVTDESLLRLSVGHSSTAMTDIYAGHITEEKARPLIDVSHTILEETEVVK
jgi:integrase